MKTLFFALPLLALTACEKADDATLNKSAVDTDMIVETESSAAVNQMIGNEQTADELGAAERNAVGF